MSVSDVQTNIPIDATFRFAGTGTHPQLQVTNVNVVGSAGGAAGFINVNGISGALWIQMHNVDTNNGANANIVRAGAESIRCQSLTTPVPSTVLTPTRGDCILDSTSNNDPFRWSGAAWTAL
jgi:hypothetical protein